MSPSRWIALALALAGIGSAAPALAQAGAVTTAAPDPVYAPVSSTEVSVVVTLLRHRPSPKSNVSLQAAGDCRDLPELSRLLGSAGPLEVLFHARREISCAPFGRADFRSVETRPAYAVDAPGAPPTNATFGLDLHADVRVVVPPTNGAPPVVLLSWEGQWMGSATLLANWEKVAIRAFNVARAVPGITYTKVEPDEDGFVNTGGGTDLGGLFRRKKPKDSGKKPPQPAATAGKSPATEREPSYFAEAVPEIVPLRGDWIGPVGQLLVGRRPLPGPDNPGDLYLVVQTLRAD